MQEMLSFFVHWCHCRRQADIFQQDSVPAHHAHQTIEFLQRETRKFIGPDLWTPNSPHRNPVDYRIWNTMQDRVHQPPIQDVADHQQRPVDTWSGFSQTIVDEPFMDGVRL